MYPQRGVETRRCGRRARRARHVPDHIPGGGHVQDAERDKREYRTTAGAERAQQDGARGVEGSDRAHRALRRPDRTAAAAAVRPGDRPGGCHGGRHGDRHGGRDTKNDDDGRGQARADLGARRPGLRQDVHNRGGVPRVPALVRRRAAVSSARGQVLRRHATRLVQPGTVARHLPTAVVRAAAERAVRAAGRVVRPTVRERLVPDAAQAVRGRVPHIHASAVHRRPAPAQPARLGRGGRPVMAAHRAARQRARAVYHALRAGRAEDDAVAKRTVP